MPDSNNPGKCLICVYGYYPEGNSCKKVSSLCKDFNVQTGACTSCANPSRSLIMGKCVDQNCQTASDDGCQTCKSGFVFSATEKICKFSDPNCLTASATSCIQCKPNFYLNDKSSCQEMPANCQNALPNGNCVSCNLGFETYQSRCI